MLTKRLLALVVLQSIIGASLATAQWTTSGSNIYNTNSGSVIIGATTPESATSLLTLGGTSDTRISIGSGEPTVWSWSNGWMTPGDFSLIQEGVNGSVIYVKPGGNVGIGTPAPRSLLDVYGGTGVNKGIRLGSYWEFGTTAYMNDAYFGVNAVLTTSDVGNGTNYFSPTWAAGHGMVMAEMGGGSGDITFYGINWNGNSTQQPFPSAFSPVMALQHNGNVGIGTISPSQALEVAGNAKVDGSLIFSDGSIQSTAFTGVLQCGADYAESVDISGDRTNYEPGDVLVVDPANPKHFLRSAEPYSTTVSGIYSTKPGVLGTTHPNDQEKLKQEVPMAMLGIVPTKVSAENGSISPGDLLVTSGNIGYAMKGTDRSRMLGAIVGKALEPLESGIGTIDVLVSLQ